MCFMRCDVHAHWTMAVLTFRAITQRLNESECRLVRKHGSSDLMLVIFVCGNAHPDNLAFTAIVVIAQLPIGCAGAPDHVNACRDEVSILIGQLSGSCHQMLLAGLKVLLSSKAHGKLHCSSTFSQPWNVQTCSSGLPSLPFDGPSTIGRVAWHEMRGSPAVPLSHGLCLSNSSPIRRTTCVISHENMEHARYAYTLRNSRSVYSQMM